MTPINLCPCGSLNHYGACCKLLIDGTNNAKTAEELMRSRYSAYVVGAIDYLVDTTHLSTRKNHKRKDIENWSKSTKWVGLEIVEATTSTVEFIATFEGENNSIEPHHEKSTFVLEGGKWYYVDGKFF